MAQITTLSEIASEQLKLENMIREVDQMIYNIRQQRKFIKDTIKLIAPNGRHETDGNQRWKA
jgi:hypothetical protein